MARVVAIEHLTLDGVYQAPARADEDRRDGFELGGWATAGNAPEMQAVLGQRMGKSWSLLVGRVTYQDFANVWSKRAGNPMSDALNNAEKFVVSNTLAEPLAWQNSILLRGDGADAVTKLKKDHGKTLVIFGSGQVVQSLMRGGLVDELVLQVHPVVLGAGRRLFDRGNSVAKLRLVDSLTTSTGVIVVTYQPL
jgi:dihydrofolate reductase